MLLFTDKEKTMTQTLAKKQADKELEKIKNKRKEEEEKMFRESYGSGEVIQPYSENMDEIKKSRMKGVNLEEEVLEMSKGGSTGSARGYGCAIKGIKQTKNR
tara:strand:- start:4253 stop:4558 length:306 start_codon:yes stop_codon:yes gene_type:complete